MISDCTVFILGAGASAPYGYPVGSGLRDDICLNFKTDMSVLSERSRGNLGEIEKYIDDIEDFVEHFQNSRVKSIDRWLGLNRRYREIGKLSIVNATIKCEHKTSLSFEGKTKSSDWFSVLFNEMMDSVRKPEHFTYHRVGFIIFNYDRVFEHLLYESFRNAFSEAPPEEIDRILSAITLVHVYGCIDEPPWKKRNYKYGDSYTLPYLSEARTRIRTIGESTRSVGTREDSVGDLLLKAAKKIFFLGFGYDSQNLEILGIPRRFKVGLESPAVFGTGYGLLLEEIETVQLNMGLANMPTIKDFDCTELLRKYFAGQHARI